MVLKKDVTMIPKPVKKSINEVRFHRLISLLSVTQTPNRKKLIISIHSTEKYWKEKKYSQWFFWTLSRFLIGFGAKD